MMMRNLLLERQGQGARTGASEIQSFASYEAWQAELALHAERFNCRWRFEQALQALAPEDRWEGWCALCEQNARFGLGPGSDLNLREELVCSGCGMNARIRGALQILDTGIDRHDSDLYITEQASPTYVWLQNNVDHVSGSEYANDAATLRALQDYFRNLGGNGSIRFEDITSLSFGDASLDAIASFDVLEHVPDYGKALHEFARVLRPGGMLVITAPFISSLENTLVRARITSEGEIHHDLPAEYHGDPLGDAGILCFYHFGWDLLDTTRAAGFTDVSMVLPWSPGAGLLGHLWTLRAIR